MKKAGLIVLAMFFLAGCGPRTIDASSLHYIAEGNYFEITKRTAITQVNTLEPFGLGADLKVLQSEYNSSSPYVFGRWYIFAVCDLTSNQISVIKVMVQGEFGSSVAFRSKLFTLPENIKCLV